jgi:hypothetical protein
MKVGAALFIAGFVLLPITSWLLKHPGSLFGLVGRGNFNDLALFVSAGVLFRVPEERRHRPADNFSSIHSNSSPFCKD